MRSKFKWISTLILAIFIQFSFSQEKEIRGTVSDELGPIPGANVVVKGTSRGVTADFDGNYSIKASQGDVLVFSFVGKKTLTVQVGQSSQYNVTLEDDVIKGNEVVVSGYFSETRGKVTGSISTIKAETIENVPLGSFDQILQGQAPGITVQSGSGQPGRAAKVRIRGTSSINGGNNPLYILDGVPISAGDFASLNANDFENVSVLKDASSTSIYGSRASGGVIVITSKKGKFNEDTQFTYRSQIGFTQIGKPNFEMMDSFQLLNFQRLIGSGLGAGKTDAEIAEIAKVNTDWADVFFRTGKTTSHELSVRGGSEKTRFYNSLSYFEQEGIAERSDLQRFTFRSNMENKASDKTTLGYNISLNFSKQNEIDSEGAVALQNPYAAAYLGSPYHPVYNADGSYAVGPGRVGPNAYENLVENQRYRNQIKVVGSVYGERELARNLKARVDFGVDFTNNYTVRSADPATQSGISTTPGNRGFYRQDNDYFAKFNTTSRLVYSNTFAEKHDFEASVFLEYIKEHFKSGGFTGYGINPSLVGYPSGITTGSTANGLIPATRGTDVENGLLSYFGVVKYGYDDRYKLDLSFRRDASNRFSDANKWGTFWSVGSSWNIHREAFMENNSLFQELRLRVSYGTTGNQQGINSFQQFATWGGTGFAYGGASGIGQTSIPNPQLQWEEGTKANIGVDFAIFNRRLTGTVEYYNNTTDKLFIQQTLPLESGLGVLDVNAGKMSNKGFDVNLEGFIVRNDNLSFSLYGNFNYNKNNIESLGQVSEFVLGTSIVREGLPFGSHFAVGWAGVNPANGEPLYYDSNGNVTNNFSDDNATANWGTYEPVYSGGFGHRLSYKGFDFSTLFTFAGDYFRYNNQTFFQENPNFAQYNLSTAMLNMWQNPGDITEIQSYQYNREFSSKDIEDASYLRFRNVQVGYSFSKKALSGIKYIDNIRIYAQAQNLATWTKFTGFDPEDDNNIAQYEYPTPRIYTFGVDVKF
ncbi:TonB-dependent receptor [Flavobacterium sediminilitoris]|uniref:TonB-dependent receptor n=1 Tax=Flavobacterium sediminilitoris TaxID=2024526 RepID=A0ABY4HI59_9FLAO|nr:MULTISPECIES: TonB-dependent receptor [Flavobacterium]UOX32225.1 TonB-dependent receptor [Flavobacterium sediminilitoris]